MFAFPPIRDETANGWGTEHFWLGLDADYGAEFLDGIGALFEGGVFFGG